MIINYILIYLILAQIFGYFQLFIASLKRKNENIGGLPHHQVTYKYVISIVFFPLLIIIILFKYVFKFKNK